MLERLERRLSFYKIRDYVSLYRRLTTHTRPPDMVPPPLKERGLVLAPHMDDEVIGCGGTLYKYALMGGEITVVYMTDGRKGNPELYDRGLPEEEIRISEEKLVGIRKEEAQSCASVLGIKNLIFLDEPDMGLKVKKGNIDRIITIMEEVKPEVVYLPFLTDNHPDHWQTNRILTAALKRKPFRFDCYGYEVWSPIYPNCMVDIGDVVEKKREALQKFESQLRHNDFVNAILGLNAYRSMVDLNGRGYVEAFFAATSKEYLSLFNYL